MKTFQIYTDDRETRICRPPPAFFFLALLVSLLTHSWIFPLLVGFTGKIPTGAVVLKADMALIASSAFTDTLIKPFWSIFPVRQDVVCNL